MDTGAPRRRHRAPRLHDNRHTFASLVIAGGMSLFHLSRVLGTSVQMIDQTYGPLLPDSDDYLRGLLNSYDAQRAASYAQVSLT